MAQGFVWDEAALERFLGAVAEGIDDWAQDEVVPEVVRVAPKRRRRYIRTIAAATFFRNRLVGRGRPVRGTRVQSKAEIWTIVYTSSPLGHILENGTQAHRIRFHSQVVDGADKYWGRIRHPGSRRFPHFGPGIIATRGRIGVTVRAGVARRLGR